MKQLLARSGSVFLKEVPAPSVGPKNILVRLTRSCVSVGTEMAGIKMSGLPLYRRALKQPHHLKRALQLMKDQGVKRVYDQIKGKLDAGMPIGYSAAGVVVEVGAAVEGFKVGDRVACAGASVANHAEFIDVPVNLAVPVPDGLEDDAAATVTLGAIALQGVRRAQPTLGETIVVVGLGILGQIAAQLLAASGCRVIGTDIDDQRIATATANGLHHGLNADRPDIVETVHRLTDGYGADGVVITAASSSDAIVAQAFQFCRRKGRVVVVGDVGLNIARADIYPKEIDLLISTSYGPGRYDSIYEEQGQDYPLAYVRWTENRNMAEYLRLLASGRVSLANMLRPPYEIDRAEKAYAALKAPGEKPLLVLLTYPEREAAAATVTVTVAPASTRSGVIRVALVGAGNFAQGVHLPNIRKLSDRFRVDTIVARTGLSATGVAERFGIVNASTNFAEVLADAGIDLVLIATRHHLHASMVLEALCTGKHVFVEKPLALSEEQLAPIVAFYEKNPNGPLLMTGYNRRFSPAIREAQRVLAGRTSPVIVNYRMNAGYIAPDHWVHGDEGGGRNIGEACHIYDIFAALTGSSPVSVQAMAVDPGSKYWRRDDNFTATIGYADGSVCTLTYTAMGSKGYAKERAEIFVDGKVLALDDYKQLSVVGAKGGWKSMTVDKGQEQELLVLSDVLRKGGTWPITLDDQLATSRVSFEVERQIKQ